MKTAVLRLLVRLLSLLPLRLSRALAAGVGWLLYRLPNRERDAARVNLKLCFPDMGESERELLLRRTLRETAITFLEMPAVWHGATDKWLARIDGDQVAEEMRALLAQGRGLIVAMPHLGNFELSSPFSARIGRATGLYRPPRKAGLEQVIVEGRNRSGQNRMVPPTRKGLKILTEALAAGEMIGILPDQVPKAARGGMGRFAPFFGVPALTMTLLSKMARRSGAPVYFLAFLRQPGTLKYKAVGRPGDSAIGGEDLDASLAALNAGVEAMVRLAPEQYQWSYRRFEPQLDGGSPYSR